MKSSHLSLYYYVLGVKVSHKAINEFIFLSFPLVTTIQTEAFYKNPIVAAKVSKQKIIGLIFDFCLERFVLAENEFVRENQQFANHIGADNRGRTPRIMESSEN